MSNRKGDDMTEPSAVIEMLARMWIECDPNRMGHPDDPVPLFDKLGKEHMEPRWHWFVPRAEETLRYFADYGYVISVDPAWAAIKDTQESAS